MYTQISKEPHWSSGTVLESHVLRRLREENFKVCLGYRPSSVPAWQHSKTLSGNKNIVQWSKALLPGSGLEFDSQCHKRKGNEVSMLFQKSDVSLVHLRTASLRPAWATKWAIASKQTNKQEWVAAEALRAMTRCCCPHLGFQNLLISTRGKWKWAQWRCVWKCLRQSERGGGLRSCRKILPRGGGMLTSFSLSPSILPQISVVQGEKNQAGGDL